MQTLIDIQGQQVESEPGEESEDESRVIDLMASDDEADEDIEPENEQDCAFLNDEVNEQEDVLFYRRLNVELDQGIRQEQKEDQSDIP